MAYKDKKDQALNSKKHYEANKKKIKARSKSRNTTQRDKNREYIKQHKRENPCIDCGEKNIVLLECDHVRGDKFKCVSDMVKGAYSLASIKKEVEKCDVRCANCHRLITYERRMKAETKKMLLDAILLLKSVVKQTLEIKTTIQKLQQKLSDHDEQTDS
tara:strand:- start:656 stop:1132 length:477 start_codon:yes stop_codon:yes gene_type:complete